MSQPWTKVGQDITTDTANFNDSYSTNSYISLSNDGTIMAVGSYTYNNDQGSVQVYKYNNNMWQTYGNTIIDPSGGQNGWSVSLSGDGTIVAIGSPRPANYSTAYLGSVQVYKYNANVWQPYGNKIVPSGTTIYTGYNLSLSNDGTIIAVAYDNTVNDIGSLQVYHYSPDTNVWNPMGAEIVNNEPLSFIKSVALSSDGTIVAIGSPYLSSTINTTTGSSAGLVQVYQLYTVTNTDGTFSYEWKQLGSNIIDASGSTYYSAKFGYTISLSSDGLTIAIGSPGADLSGPGENGLAQVYRYSNDKGWVKLGNNIVAVDKGYSGQATGYSVSLSSDGNIVAVGSPGAGGTGIEVNGVMYYTQGIVQVYQYSNDTTTWTQISQDIYDGIPQIEAATGSAVSLSSNGTVVVFGSPNAISSYIDDNGNDSQKGIVQVYQKPSYEVIASMKNGTRLLRRNNDSKEEYVPMKHLKKGDKIRTWKHGWRKITGLSNDGEPDLRDFPNRKKHCRAFLIRRDKLRNKC